MVTIAYPAILFVTDETPPAGRGERFLSLPDERRLTTLEGGVLRSGARVGAILVDSLGQTLTIRSVRDGGYRTPIVLAIVATMLGRADDVEHAVAYEFAGVPPLAFPEVQARVCAILDRDADAWVDPDAVDIAAAHQLANEALAVAKAAVAQSGNVGEIFAGLDAAWARMIPNADPPSEDAATPRKTGIWSGRGDRREFIFFGLPLVTFETAYIAVLEWVAPNGLGDSAWLLPSFALLMTPILLLLPLMVRRLHDLGRSAIWIFFAGTAIKLATAALKAAGLGALENPLGLAAIGAGVLYLAIARGNAVENAFGAPPARRGR